MKEIATVPADNEGAEVAEATLSWKAARWNQDDMLL